jgi:EipB-like
MVQNTSPTDFLLTRGLTVVGCGTTRHGMIQVVLAASALSASVLFAPTFAQGAPADARLLVPHRAVYDVQLDESSVGDAVSAVSGRLVFEFTGSVCEGFTQNLRFVMTITNREGADSVSDLRTSTWEAADGSRFRFSNTVFDNQQGEDPKVGNAERRPTETIVKLDKPAPTLVKLEPTVLFPVQHTVELLAAARSAKPFFTANLYDGSDKANKAIFTSSVIGKATVYPGATPQFATIKNADKLNGLKQWPVTIAYYATGSAEALGTPQQEMRFSLFDNGVIGALTIDYGDLAVKGTLSDITFYPSTACPP